MGCTTSVVLLEGLRSILERNCSYVKGSLELAALEEEDETQSLWGAHLWMPTTALVNNTSTLTSKLVYFNHLWWN